MTIDEIVAAIQSGRVRVTDHADEEMAADQLALDEVCFSVTNGEILEQYPWDVPYPSCLVFGQAPDGVALHSVWAYNPSSGWAVLITVYRPDPKRWVNWRQRRRIE